MRTCPECGMSFEGTGSFCPNCGKYMPYRPEPAPVYSEPAPVYSESAPVYTEQTPVYSEPVQMNYTEQQPMFTQSSDLGTQYGYNPEMPPQTPVQCSSEGFTNVADENKTEFKPYLTPSIWSCLLSIFLFSLPIIGFIYMICLAFGATKYVSKKNFARALFLWFFINIIIICAVIAVCLFLMPDAADFFGYDGFGNAVSGIFGNF